jgi:hypothetical protein
VGTQGRRRLSGARRGASAPLTTDPMGARWPGTVTYRGVCGLCFGGPSFRSSTAPVKRA